MWFPLAGPDFVVTLFGDILGDILGPRLDSTFLDASICRFHPRELHELFPHIKFKSSEVRTVLGPPLMFRSIRFVAASWWLMFRFGVGFSVPKTGSPLYKHVDGLAPELAPTLEPHLPDCLHATANVSHWPRLSLGQNPDLI